VILVFAPAVSQEKKSHLPLRLASQDAAAGEIKKRAAPD
jgi:hypothetical protein